jgi:hypothetical protein
VTKVWRLGILAFLAAACGHAKSLNSVVAADVSAEATADPAVAVEVMWQFFAAHPLP